MNVPDLHFCKADAGVGGNTRIQKMKKGKEKKKILELFERDLIGSF